ncbi:hypothetical protein PAPHI01_0440 [Pancytospora philotis]|nr:hypothetical protein PAPHI01_0440 [Pancytospora philotis]
MVAVRALALGTAFVALFVEASTKPKKTGTKIELSMRAISPFNEVANKWNRHEKDIFNGFCKRAGKITAAAKQHRASELIEMLVAAIFENAQPIAFINEKIVSKSLIFERAMIANAIRLKLRILRDSTQHAGAANEKLWALMDNTRKELDEFVSDKCKLPFEAFYMESLRQNPIGRYDQMLYLFIAYTEGKEEGVRKRFCDIIDTGLPKVENGYSAIYRPVRTFLSYLSSAISVYKIDKFDFTKILLKHLTSKEDYGAVAMVDHLEWEGITKDRVLQYITSGGDKDVSLRFVVNFLIRNRLWLNESCTWVKERLLDFFREPHLSGFRRDAPSEQFYYMLCTCFDDQGLRPIVPELAQFMSEMVDPRTVSGVMELAENDPDRTGLLDGMKMHPTPLASSAQDKPSSEQSRKRRDAAEDDGSAKKMRSATELAAFTAECASAASRRRGKYREAVILFEQISPLTEYFPSTKKNDRTVVEVINRRALSILRNEQGYAEGDPRKYKIDTILPNMVHRITRCALRAGSLRSHIDGLLKDKTGLSDLKLLASIIRITTTTEVLTDELEAELIVPHGKEPPRDAQKAIDFLQVQIDRQLALAPREFLAMYKSYDYPRDAIDYLFKDEKNGVQAVQAHLEAILKAWCDEMDRGSDAFTPYVVSLISELEKNLCKKETAKYKLRDVVLRILTSQGNTKVVEALDRIIFKKIKAEECILLYLMSAEHRHIDPFFVLQYIPRIQSKLGKDDQWALEAQVHFFALPALAVDRQQMITGNPDILRRMPYKVLARLLHAYWKTQALRSGLPRLFSTISQTFDPFVVGVLVNEAGQCGDASFIESAQRGFLDSAVAAQAGEQG